MGVKEWRIACTREASCKWEDWMKNEWGEDGCGGGCKWFHGGVHAWLCSSYHVLALLNVATSDCIVWIWKSMVMWARWIMQVVLTTLVMPPTRSWYTISICDCCYRNFRVTPSWTIPSWPEFKTLYPLSTNLCIPLGFPSSSEFMELTLMLHKSL